MLIYDGPLLNRQPPLSRHLPVPQGLPALNGVQQEITSHLNRVIYLFPVCYFLKVSQDVSFTEKDRKREICGSVGRNSWENNLPPAGISGNSTGGREGH